MSRQRGRLYGRSSRRRRQRGEDINPMDGVGNMFDVMMVFACGLMIAIMMLWNIDLNNVVNIIDQTELVELDEDEAIDQSNAAASNYNNIGTAIEDPNTGKTFVVSDDNQVRSDSDNSGNDENSGSSQKDK